MSFDIKETPITFDHTNQELHIFTSVRSVFLNFIKRNPNYIKAEKMSASGYSLIYKLSRVRKPEQALKAEDGGQAKLQEWLTPEEQARRQEAAARMVALLAT